MVNEPSVFKETKLFFNNQFILAIWESAYLVIMNLEYFLHIFII